MRKPSLLIVVGMLGSLLVAGASHAQVTAQVTALQQRWAEVNYLLKGKSQVEALNTLIEDARKVTDADSASAEAWIWSGIIRSSYAGAKRGLGALTAARAARADIEKGMAIDADALNGAAYTALGMLYLNVPNWPVGFGDKEKGIEYLKKGLELSPAGIDSNYFYAEYLFKEAAFAESTHYLNRALNAPARPGRELADEGRHGEIEALLREIEETN